MPLLTSAILLQNILKGLHHNNIQNANPKQAFGRGLILVWRQKILLLEPMGNTEQRRRLNFESFDTWADYFWVWGETWGTRARITPRLHLHVDLDNKQVRHLRVMLHISSSIPCLLSWNFSSEDNPGNIEQEINHIITLLRTATFRSNVNLLERICHKIIG